MDGADLLVIGAPHRRYAELSTAKPVVDIWDVRGQGSRGYEAPGVRGGHRPGGGRGHQPALRSSAEAVKLPCEILVVCDSREDSTVPWVEKYAKQDDRVRLVLNNYGPGRPRP